MARTTKQERRRKRKQKAERRARTAHLGRSGFEGLDPAFGPTSNEKGGSGPTVYAEFGVCGAVLSERRSDIERAGGEWATMWHPEPCPDCFGYSYVMLSTVQVCEGEPSCRIDHAGAGLYWLAQFRRLAYEHPEEFVERSAKSSGWPFPFLRGEGGSRSC